MKLARIRATLSAIAAFALLSSIAIAGDLPGKITIKSLENLYGPAVFDHKMHIETADSCKTCHHKPFGKPMGCGDCHDDTSKLGDFNHEQHWEFDGCASCHRAKSTHELACSSCHLNPYDKKQLHVLGLKGALHAQCMDCHEKNGVENSCTTCHVKK